MIVKYIVQRCHCHMYTSMHMIIYKPNRILKLKSIYGFGYHCKTAPVGKDWYYLFLDRHSHLLGMRKLQKLEISRLKGRVSVRILEYFQFFRDLMVEHKFENHRIYNML